MRKILLFCLLLYFGMSLQAQRILSLDSCRSLALRNNKQLTISRIQQDVAYNTRKAVRTKQLPKIDAMAGYEHFSKEVSLLNRHQKSGLSQLGTQMTSQASGTIAQMAQQGMITPEMAQQLSNLFSELGTPLSQAGNSIGQTIRDAFRTDTRNMWAGSIMLRQPVYMGGAITAANRMADIGEQVAANDLELKRQSTLFDIDQAYWLAVSLRQKEQLAYSYRDLVRKLDDDVYNMIREGVATRADGLKVDVRVNEADMQLTQVEDGLALAKMLICQLCGLPMDEEIVLADECMKDLPLISYAQIPADSSAALRPEIRMLQNAIELSQATTRLIRSEYMPHVALTGGYLISNPNVFNGFERKFSGVWNIGLVVQFPIWNWLEGSYKIRASRAATSIASLQLKELQEKIGLQVSQCRFKVKEAQKKLSMAQKNIQSAEENLRCANVGFREGVMDATDVMAAQTAWQQAMSQKIDAEIDVRLSQVNLQKALGILQ